MSRRWFVIRSRGCPTVAVSLPPAHDSASIAAFAMPIPTQYDRDLAEIDDLHGFVIIRLRTLQHGGAGHNGGDVRQAWEQYTAAVTALVGDRRCRRSSSISQTRPSPR